MNCAPGCFAFSLMIFCELNVSCTMHAPGHRSMSRPVFLIKNAPRFLSGPNKIGRSFGIELMIVSAFDDVQIMSLSALVPAEQLMYITTKWSG